jgi:hypothetical protein
MKAKMTYLERAAMATVTITRKRGKGVLVNGGLILTAAHCITYHCEGQMVLGDYYIETIKTAGGKLLKAQPLAVEPVSDIAVLGALDGQDFGDEVLQFETFCEKTKPVPMCLSRYRLFQSFSVRILNRDWKWVRGNAMICAEGAPVLFVEAKEQVKGGASGGPIINESGELVGIVSNFSFRYRARNGDKPAKFESTGSVPCPHLTLPVWVRDKILGKRC